VASFIQVEGEKWEDPRRRQIKILDRTYCVWAGAGGAGVKLMVSIRFFQTPPSPTPPGAVP
jgi:hypothetical protein